MRQETGYLTTHTPLPERPSPPEHPMKAWPTPAPALDVKESPAQLILSWLLAVHHGHAGGSGLWPWAGHHDKEVHAESSRPGPEGEPLSLLPPAALREKERSKAPCQAHSLLTQVSPDSQASSFSSLTQGSPSEQGQAYGCWRLSSRLLLSPYTP